MTDTKTKSARVLIAKPGLDGHDVGAKVVCRALMNAGMEVIYTGLRATPEQIADAAAQEDVNVVGLSILSGAHVPLTKKVVEELRRVGADDITLIVGGNIPAGDAAALKELGATEVFATGTHLDDIVEFIRQTVEQ